MNLTDRITRARLKARIFREAGIRLRQQSRPSPLSKERSSDLLTFLQTYTRLNGFPPSIREMADGIGVRSTANIHATLSRLAADGLIHHEERLHRTWTWRGNE